MRFCSLILAVLWPAIPVGALEGPPRFERLSLEDGLSQSIVESIVQDEVGFMWFATENGLNRYDGYEFTVFQNQAGNPNTLSHVELKTVYLDSSGVLWIGTFEGGLNRFDPETEKVTRYLHDPREPTSLSGRPVRCVAEDSDDRLWVGTQGGGLSRLDFETGRFEHYRHDPDRSDSLSDDDVRALLVDPDGRLWVGTQGGGLNRYDRTTDGFEHFRHDPARPDSLSHDDVRSLHQDGSHGMWIGTYGGGLNRLEHDRTEFVRYVHDPDRPGSLSSNLVTSMTTDHTGVLWIGTDGGGLNVQNPVTGSFESFRHDPHDLTSLSTDRIYSVYEDRSQVLWVGTYGGGLSRFDVGRKHFHHYYSDPNNDNSLSHNIVWSFAEDPQGGLWIGTDSGGLNHFDPKTDRWRAYVNDPDDPTSLSHNTVRSVFFDSHRGLWVATNGGGLNRFDHSTGRFTRFRHDPNDPHSLSHDDLRSIFEDSSGTLWVATFGGGLNRFDRATERFTHFRHDPTDPSSISHDFLRMVYEDRQGVLWIGTHGGGLDRYDPESGRFDHLTNDSDDSSTLPNDLVFAVHEGHDGTLWVGTFGGGLSSLDRETGHFRRFQTQHGPPCNTIYAILEDKEGRLWISTTSGLFRFNPRTGLFRNFDQTDGLQSNEFNGGSAFRSPGGAMYFGGIKGFNAFYPSEIVSNPVPPTVVITDFQLFNRSLAIGELVRGKPILSRSIAFVDDIELSHRDNIFSFEFAALHYSAPGKNEYAYRLEGFNNDWVRTNAARRFATFTNLAPGTYVFRVRGSNSDGVWNDDGASIRIAVTPPITATWWFRLVAAALIATAGVVAVRRRMNAVRMKTALTAAHDAQMAIMPQTDPELKGFEISGGCWPAFEVGGDFFDYLRLEDDPNRLGIAVGDVSGKGMKAAMTAVMSNGMVFSRAMRPGTIEEVLTDINRSIHRKAGKRMFTALCLATVDSERKEMAFANAGLCQPLHKTSAGVHSLESEGPRLPLGAFFDTVYQRTTAAVEPGDVIVLFSDGIPEAQNSKGQLYGYQAPSRLLDKMDTDSMSAAEIKMLIANDVIAFAGGSKQADDITVVVVKVDL